MTSKVPLSGASCPAYSHARGLKATAGLRFFGSWVFARFTVSRFLRFANILAVGGQVSFATFLRSIKFPSFLTDVNRHIRAVSSDFRTAAAASNYR